MNHVPHGDEGQGRESETSNKGLNLSPDFQWQLGSSVLHVEAIFKLFSPDVLGLRASHLACCQLRDGGSWLNKEGGKLVYDRLFIANFSLTRHSSRPMISMISLIGGPCSDPARTIRRAFMTDPNLRVCFLQ